LLRLPAPLLYFPTLFDVISNDSYLYYKMGLMYAKLRLLPSYAAEAVIGLL